MVEEEDLISATTQGRRWVFTINNPLGEGVEEIDITKTDLSVKEDYYSSSIIQELKESNCFNFKYIKVSKKIDEFNFEEFVINRPFFKSIESAQEYLQNLESFKYCVFQLELGEKEETPHFQGFLTFKGGKRFRTVKAMLPFAHLEKAKGSNTQCREYCTKKETRIEGPFEIGQFAEERARTDRKEFIEMIKSGMSDSELMELDANNFLSINDNKIARIRESKYDHYRTKYRSVDVTFIYGPSGVGKTTYLAKMFDPTEAFDVTNYDNSMFSNYQYQDIIILDEFNGTMSVKAFNLLMGFKPVDLRGLGCAKVSAYHHVYIISNYSLKEIERKMCGEDYRLYQTIDRRINKIIHFKSSTNIVVERDTEWEDVTDEIDLKHGLTKNIKRVWQLDDYGNKTIIYNKYEGVPEMQEVKNIDCPFGLENVQEKLEF